MRVTLDAFLFLSAVSNLRMMRYYFRDCAGVEDYLGAGHPNEGWVLRHKGGR